MMPQRNASSYYELFRFEDAPNIFNYGDIKVKLYLNKEKTKSFSFIMNNEDKKFNFDFQLPKWNVYFVKIIFFKYKKLLFVDLQKLLKVEYSDVKIVTNDSEFQVHKCILSLKSNVFETMFNIDMLEKKNNEINFKEWDTVTVQEFVNYIYTDHCNLFLENVSHNLFKLSHLWEMKDLQNLCKNHLLNNLSIENIVETLKLINTKHYNLNDTKIAADNFVKSHGSQLSVHSDYLEYLCSTLDCYNNENEIIDDDDLKHVMNVFQFSSKYGIKDLVSKVMDIFKVNFKKFWQNDECKQILLTEDSKLLFCVIEFLID